MEKRIRLLFIHDKNSADSRELLSQLEQYYGTEQIDVVDVEKARDAFPLRAVPAVSILLWADTLEEIGDLEKIMTQVQYFKSEDFGREIIKTAIGLGLEDEMITRAADEGILEANDWVVGARYEVGQIVRYEKRLYAVMQTVTAQAHQSPNAAGMLAVYRPIELGTETSGTIGEPIPFVVGMDVEKDKYYSYNGKVYLAKSDLKPCHAGWVPGSAGMWQWEIVG